MKTKISDLKVGQKYVWMPSKLCSIDFKLIEICDNGDFRGIEEGSNHLYRFRKDEVNMNDIKENK